jgi:hypothetical protein
MTTLFSLGNHQISPNTPDACPGTHNSNLASHQCLTTHYVYPTNPRPYPRQHGQAPASSATRRTTAMHPVCQRHDPPSQVQQEVPRVRKL